MPCSVAPCCVSKRHSPAAYKRRACAVWKTWDGRRVIDREKEIVVSKRALGRGPCRGTIRKRLVDASELIADNQTVVPSCCGIRHRRGVCSATFRTGSPALKTGLLVDRILFWRAYHPPRPTTMPSPRLTGIWVPVLRRPCSCAPFLEARCCVFLHPAGRARTALCLFRLDGWEGRLCGALLLRTAI